MAEHIEEFLEEPRVDVPFAPRKWPFFYGWMILIAAIFGTLASIPGQTIGVGVFKEPLLEVLAISELTLTVAYGIGTGASSFILPFAGKVIDRVGARAMVVYASLAMGASLFLFSRSASIILFFPESYRIAATMSVMSITYLCVRFTGQGCMTLVPRVMIGKWFNHRRGLAAGILGLFIAFGFNSSPTFLNMMVESLGWSRSLLVMAFIIGVGMTVFGWIFYRDNPESCGLVQDGISDPEWLNHMREKFPDVHRHFTRNEALKTPAFWAFSLALASQSLIMTAVAFHIATIASNQGIESEVAYGMLIPMGGVSVVSNFIGAWLSDRIKLKWLLFVMMGMQIFGIIGLMDVANPTGRLFYIIGMGISGGLFGALITIVWPRYFGRRHLGAISGMNLSMIVFGSAIAPALFSAGQMMTGTYLEMMALSCLAPMTVLLISLFAQNPQRKYAAQD